MFGGIFLPRQHGLSKDPVGDATLLEMGGDGKAIGPGGLDNRHFAGQELVSPAVRSCLYVSHGKSIHRKAQKRGIQDFNGSAEQLQVVCPSGLPGAPAHFPGGVAAWWPGAPPGTTGWCVRVDRRPICQLTTTGSSSGARLSFAHIVDDDSISKQHAPHSQGWRPALWSPTAVNSITPTHRQRTPPCGRLQMKCCQSTKGDTLTLGEVRSRLYASDKRNQKQRRKLPQRGAKSDANKEFFRGPAKMSKNELLTPGDCHNDRSILQAATFVSLVPFCGYPLRPFCGDCEISRLPPGGVSFLSGGIAESKNPAEPPARSLVGHGILRLRSIPPAPTWNSAQNDTARKAELFTLNLLGITCWRGCITKGDGFEFDAHRILDRNHRAGLEDKRRQQGAELVDGGGIIAIQHHIAAPVAHSNDEYNSILKLAGPSIE